MKQKYLVKINQGSSQITDKDELSNLKELFSSTCDLLDIEFGSNKYEETIKSHGAYFYFLAQFQIKCDFKTGKNLLEMIKGMGYIANFRKI